MHREVVLRVFVASTYSDLLDYRAAATRAILMASNIPEDMLYWPSEESEALDVSLRRLRASNVLVLIIAHRYGVPPEGMSKSVTELEFEEALETRMPILAFCVDSDHPWPPRFVDTDVDTRDRLAHFKLRVQEKVTWTLFTTPESLEVAISHALAHLRSNEANTGLTKPARARLRAVLRPESLYYAPNALIRVGDAPDGAPLLLDVKRELPIASSVEKVATLLRKLPDDPMLAEITSQLNQEARSLAISDQIHDTIIAGRHRVVYITDTPLAGLVAPSLFQSMLTRATRRRSVSQQPESTMSSGIRNSVEFESLGGANRFMCVALDGPKSVWSGGWVYSGDSRQVQVWRGFIEEGLERLPDVWYTIETSEHHSSILETQTASEFHEKWVELLSSLDRDELAKMSTGVYVPRASIMKLIRDVMREVAAMHAQGKVHGDLKPSNILVSRNGPALIDEVGVGFGEVSPTVTVNWSPPEQLLRAPLTYAADIYPLGELIRHVLQAESLGKQVRYGMPGNTMADVCENPTIYMDPDSRVLPVEARSEWYELIERALAAQPGDRWESVEAMGSALERVMESAPIFGDVAVSYPWGQQPKLVRTEEGEVRMAWMLLAPEDSRWAVDQW